MLSVIKPARDPLTANEEALVTALLELRKTNRLLLVYLGLSMAMNIAYFVARCM